MLPRVIDARHAGGYRVWIRFSDGLSGEIDLTNQLWGPVFEPLKDPEQFARLTVDADSVTIVWPNGADLSPSWLYAELKGKTVTAAAE
jgi:hypothetical protein